MTFRNSLAALLILGLAFPPGSRGEEPTSSEAVELGQSTLKTLWETQDRVKTGIVRGKESGSSTNRDGVIHEHRATFDVLFDYPQQRFWFARVAEGADSKVDTTTVIEVNEGSVHYGPQSGNVVLLPVDFFAGSKAGKLEFQFDVRTIGLEPSRRHGAWRSSDARTYFSSLPVEGRRLDEGRVIELTFLEYKGLAQRRVRLDREQGGMPVRMEMRYRRSPEDDWSDAKSTIDVTWEQRSEEWVPVEVESKDARTVHKLTLDWQSVNEEVPEALFNWRRMALPAGTRVIDRRTDPEKPMLLETIGN